MTENEAEIGTSVGQKPKYSFIKQTQKIVKQNASVAPTESLTASASWEKASSPAARSCKELRMGASLDMADWLWKDSSDP